MAGSTEVSRQELSGSEILARYVLQRSHIRFSDETVKPDAFIPHPYQELSVTRHMGLPEKTIWSHGQTVADRRQLRLYGRGDFQAEVAQAQQLSVQAAPLSENPNHANVGKWPEEKPLQKIKAMEIAARASFQRAPD